MKRIVKLLAIPYIFLALVLAYVGLDYYNSVPYNPSQEWTYFEPAKEGSATKARIDEAFEGTDNDSAGVVLFRGGDSLSARLGLIRSAQHTIDMQYFLLTPDYAGAMLSFALIEAANRGVRVRFLIDDVFTTTSNEQIQYLASHENITVKIFSPISRKLPKLLNYPLDPLRSNRRMHNKTFTVDGVVAIVGGRNLADEYYDIDKSTNFADFDVMLVGEVVNQVGADFDLFWNDEFSVAVNDLLGTFSQEQVAIANERIAALNLSGIEEVYTDVVNTVFLSLVGNEDYPVFQFKAQTVVDQPAKLRTTTQLKEFFPVVANVKARFEAADNEIILLSPYFVPEQWGEDMLTTIARDGVNVRVVTNSLEATNHAYVNGGYNYRRKALLEAGVELYEVRADSLEARNEPNEDGTFTKVTMHTKLAIIDRETVFVGSLNFDPRSIYLNTEFGVFIESPEMAEYILSRYEAGLDNYAYKLSLDNDGDIEWHYAGVTPPEVYDSEPAGMWRRFVAFMAWVLPVELQL